MSKDSPSRVSDLLKEELKKERQNILSFSQLRKEVQGLHYDPKAYKLFPSTKVESKSLPRPGSAIDFAKGSQQFKMSQEDENRLKQSFQDFDADNSGSIHANELEAIMMTLDIELDPDHLELLLRHYDEDDSGVIELQEFMMLYTDVMEELDDMRKHGFKNKYRVDKYQAVYVHDAEDRIRLGKITDIIETKEQQPLGIPDVAALPGEEEVKKVAKVIKREYVVTLRDGEEEENVTVSRGFLWTKDELKLPQTAVTLAEVAPPKREAKIPDFNSLRAKGVAPDDIKRYTSFAHRECFAMNDWYPILQDHAYYTAFVPLDPGDVDALLHGNWDFLHEHLLPRVKPVFENPKFQSAASGLLPRISTRTPSDFALSAACILTNAHAEAVEAQDDFREFAARHKRNQILPPRLAARHGLGLGHVPTKKDVKTAKKKAELLDRECKDLQRSRGRQRILQFHKQLKTIDAEVTELEKDRDRLISEYVRSTEVEKERLSLIDQMHAGPFQADLASKSRRKIRYLETTLLDTKAIFAERIEVARNRDDNLDEGKIAMEAETEDIERLMLQTASILERFIASEVKHRLADVRNRSIEYVRDTRKSRVTIWKELLSEEEELERICWIQRAIRTSFAKREMQKAISFWSEVRGNIVKCGPSLPLSRHCVLSLGIPVMSHYQGSAITLELETGKVESRTISRYSERREVQVRVPFSEKPHEGGRFAISPPDSCVSLHAMMTEAFLIQSNMAGANAVGISGPELRRALAANGLTFSESEADSLIQCYGIIPAPVAVSPRRSARAVSPVARKQGAAQGPSLDSPSGGGHVRAGSSETSPLRSLSPTRSGSPSREGTGPRRTTIDFEGFKRVVTGDEFKEKVVICCESCDETDLAFEFLNGALNIIANDEASWDSYGVELGDILTPPAWHKEFLGRSFQSPSAPFPDFSQSANAETINLDSGEYTGSQVLGASERLSVEGVDLDEADKLVVKDRTIDDPSIVDKDGEESERTAAVFGFKEVPQSPSRVGTTVRLSGANSRSASSSRMTSVHDPPSGRGIPGSPLGRGLVVSERSPAKEQEETSCDAERATSPRFRQRARPGSATISRPGSVEASPPRKEKISSSFECSPSKTPSKEPANEEGFSKPDSDSRKLDERAHVSGTAFGKSRQGEIGESVEIHTEVQEESEGARGGDGGTQARLIGVAQDAELMAKAAAEMEKVKGGVLRKERLVSLLKEGGKRLAESRICSFIGLGGKRVRGRGFLEGGEAEDVDGMAERRKRRRASLVMLGLFSVIRLKNQAGMDRHYTVGSDVLWPHFGVMHDVDGYIVRTKPSRADDDLENYEQMFEKIALAASGGCSLAFKARTAQNAGAIGIIIECTREEIDEELLKLSIPEQNAQTNAELGEWEEKHRVPEYERRSTIRIPVVLIEENNAWILKQGCRVQINVYDKKQLVPINAWPWLELHEAMVDQSVRDDWRCMSNIFLRAFHTVCLSQLPVASHPDDPDSWTLEQLNESLAELNWKPRAHKEYSQADLAKIARQMKSRLPGAKHLQIFKVQIVEGEHLPMLDIGIKACAYISISFVGNEKRTRTVRESQDPVWKEAFKFQCDDDQVRRDLLSAARDTFLQFCQGDEISLDIDGLAKVLSAMKIKETPKKMMDRFDVKKTGDMGWGEFVYMFDELGLDVRDLIITLHDSAVGGKSQVVGKAILSMKTLRSGETRNINVIFKDAKDPAEPLYGHNGRICNVKIRVSKHDVSTACMFDIVEKEAIRIVTGSDKVNLDLESCCLLGPPHNLKLALTVFQPIIAENPHREFRVFVRDSNVTAITQRYGHLFFVELSERTTLEAFKMKILNFFHHSVKSEMEEETFTEYILDLFIAPASNNNNNHEEECVKILSVKPFDDAVDGVLFDWSDRNDRDVLEDGEIMPNEVPQYVTLDNREKVSNVLVRVVLEPREDPLSSLSPLWERSLKQLVKDMGLTDPHQSAGDLYADNLIHEDNEKKEQPKQQYPPILTKPTVQTKQKSAACSIC